MLKTAIYDKTNKNDNIHKNEVQDIRNNEIMHKQEIGLLWTSESFEVKYSIGFVIPIEFPRQNKKIWKSG